MRRTHLSLYLTIFVVLAVSSSLLIKSQASVSGTGIGIRKEGPLYAHVNDTIAYTITVYNLGNYLIRNITITDRFPNGTSTSWNAPDLLPRGISGDSFNLSGIFYTIRDEDILGGKSYVINHAETAGYSYVQGLYTSASAQTDFVTFISITVGGFSFSMKTSSGSAPTTVYIVSLFMVTAALPIFKLCRRKAHSERRASPRC